MYSNQRCRTVIPHFGPGDLETSERNGLRILSRRGMSYLLTMLMMVCTASISFGQETADYFRQNCMSCHTIGGGRLVGPDLKDVTGRQSRDWLIRFIRDPQGMIDSGDPYAAQILADANNVVMTQVVGMSADQAGYLIDLISAESAMEESQFKGLQVDDRPFTDEDRALGREIFLGRTPLVNGGPACIGCHTMRDLGGLGGGRLGPDLTQVFIRLGPRAPLNAWLYSPATSTMTSVFADHAIDENERRGLVAFFQEAPELAAGDDDSSARLNFFLIGLGGSVLALAVFDGLWKKRFRGVRRQMIDERNARIMS